MKFILFAYFSFSFFISSARIVRLPKNSDGGLYKPKHNIQPGDTVLMEGPYSYIFLENINGSPQKPVVILNKGLVKIGMETPNYCFIIVNSNYVHIDGSGSPLYKYGFQIGSKEGMFSAQSLSFAGSNIEINNVEIKNSQLGFFSNSKTGGPWKKIYIHHNYIHNLDNPAEFGRTEGVYIGNTDPSTYNSSGSFDSVDIAFNVFENLSGDGIQVARTKNLNIHDNEINNYGKANLEQQRSGIIVGGCSSGVVKNNKITNGTGAAMQIFGAGAVTIENNTIQKTASSTNEDAIYINAKCLDGPKLKVRIINNKIDQAKRYFINDVNATPAVIENKGNQLGQKQNKQIKK